LSKLCIPSTAGPHDAEEAQGFGFAERGCDGMPMHPVFYKIIKGDRQSVCLMAAMVAEFDANAVQHLAR
jgi:hypothetical protein